jgi:hypothetical protein
MNARDDGPHTLATRKPVRFFRQRPAGRDMHFWFKVTGLDVLPVGRWLPHPPTARCSTTAATGPRSPPQYLIAGSAAADRARRRAGTAIVGRPSPPLSGGG